MTITTLNPPLRTRLKIKLNKLKAILKNPRHDISLVITVAFIFISALCFQTSWQRIGESFRDIYTSIAHAFADVEPTVNKPSAVGLKDLGIFPKDLDLFLTKLRLYGQSLLNKTTYQYFLIWLLNIVRSISIVILSCLLPMGVVVFIAWLMLRSTNNKYNQDTKPLQIVKFIADYTYWPLKRGVSAYLSFLKDHKIYPIIWAVIWALNFNFVTIILEVIAYYYYFSASLDFVNLYMQLYKLLLDLSTLILFFPLWAWAIIFIVGFDIYRKFISLQKLKKLEEKCEEIIAELPIAVLITGTMNTGKTTFLTELAITYNKYFRDVADKKMFEITMRFPNFPWINLERCIKHGLEYHTIYNLATCKQFIRYVKKYYENPRASTAIGKRVTKLRYKFLDKKYGYIFDNFIFDYDVNRYGFTYYDNLKVETIFDVLESYAQHYFIYVISCSLMLANYSIRVDDFLRDKGNFPLWDIDFFRNDPEKIKEHTHRSHILDYDALRLGARVIEDNRFKDSIDFGIIVITEVGKERANQKTIKGEYFTADSTYENGAPVLKKGGDGKDYHVTVNPETDLLNLDIKMCRHRATVDNFPYVVFLMDEQRAASLNADNKDLADILYIAKRSDYKFITPLFAVDELIYMGTVKFMHWFHKKDRNNKGNNTLLRHSLRNVFASLIFKHYERLFNMYSVSTLTFNVQDGMESDSGHKMKYRLSKKKVHAARFATDAYGDYYYEKTKRSPVGIVDIPEYAGEQATRSEHNQTHGNFARGMDKMFPKGK